MSEPAESPDFIITARDVKAAGYCIVPGLKGYLESRGYSLKDFIRDGLPASTMRGFNDAQSDRAILAAMERLNRG